jgi:catechol 2,3-dioxygenase-like lactoylglutathione lyase family enzyme
VLGFRLRTREKRMRAFLRLTPNLVVRDVERSVRFYCDVLGFEMDKHVPDQQPFVFASVRGGGVEIFFNQHETVVGEYPAFKDVPLGGTFTLYLAMQGVDDLHKEVQERRIPVVMPIETKFYGVREFAIADPDGYLLTLAERVD